MISVYYDEKIMKDYNCMHYNVLIDSGVCNK